MRSSSLIGKPILAALAGMPTEPNPLWLMRQAGRYLPEYRELRKQALNFLDFCFRPELAIEATLQPIRRYGFDGAVLFSDILTVPWALGQKVEFTNGEGPKLEPIRSEADIDRLSWDGAIERLTPVYRTVAGVAAQLPAKTALIGFAGAPWTIASYMVQGGGDRDFIAAREMALSNPAAFGRLIDILVAATVDHLSAQIEAGAELVQLFDSWSGVLSEDQFRRWSIEPTRAIADALRQKHPAIPIIGFPRGAGGMLGDYARLAGVTAIGIDTQTPLSWALSQLPDGFPVQGNLDPVALVVGGKTLAYAVAAILDKARDRPLIFNLGHGVPQVTPPEHVAELVRLVRGA